MLMSGRQSSAVDKALRLVAQGSTAYAAAKKTGIALSTIYRALKRQEEQTMYAQVQLVEATWTTAGAVRSFHVHYERGILGCIDAMPDKTAAAYIEGERTIHKNIKDAVAFLIKSDKPLHYRA